ncbi:MAG: hypothetical protein KatS3mg115_1114 [Candidatus Poribacteria bacterium]|nr:MAG: hypothetical protein KatS3mg115_1114 [Candidatus Poribacteria bacterium]
MKSLLRVATLFVLGAVALGGRAETAQELLARVAERYTSARRYHFQSVEVIQLLGEGMESVRLETEVTIAADEPNRRYLIDVRNPFDALHIVSDGQTMTLYNPMENIYRRESIPPGEELPEDHPLSIVANWMSLYRGLAESVDSAKLLEIETVQVGEEKVRAQKVEVIFKPDRVPPQLGDPRPKTFWVDPQATRVVQIAYPQTLALNEGATVEAMNTTRFRRIQIGEELPAELFTFQPPEGAIEEKLLTGEEAPDFTLPNLEGKAVQLKQLRGKVVLLDFWATWCGPCLEELPILQKLHEEFAEKGLVVLGVNNEELPTVQAFYQEHGLTFQTVSDPQNTVFRRYVVRNIPTVLVINREGVVVAHYIGAQTEETLRSALAKAGLE